MTHLANVTIIGVCLVLAWVLASGLPLGSCPAPVLLLGGGWP